MVTVETDPGSGFCGGVIRAIGTAEEFLDAGGGRLYSLGAIVHNEEELARLEGRGLVPLGKEQLGLAAGQTLLIRAHGEPPQVYARLKELDINVIDCTCPVVLKLQERVRETWQRIRASGGQVVIFGKKGHAEVNGLVGQTDGEAIVISSAEDLSGIDFSRPVALFSQTTKDPDEFRQIAARIREERPDAEVYDTICRQVVHRHQSLVEFAQNHSVILFVSGRESSNGKVLFELCRSINARTWWLENASQIDMDWFRDGDSVGICGATSTPKWQLEEIFIYLQDVTK